MKKVLIISYYWPPAGGPGSQRAVKFAKYLPEFGWEPVVLTVRKGEFPYIDLTLSNDIPSSLKIFKTNSVEPFTLFKTFTGRKKRDLIPIGLLTSKKGGIRDRIAYWIRTNLFVPDARIGWIPLTYKFGLDIIKKERIDIIFTTSPPHSLQLSGYLLKRKTGLPWVTDLRDPWVDIRYYEHLNRFFMAEKLDTYFENKVLSSTNYLISINSRIIDHYLNKRNLKDYKAIPNGFDQIYFDKYAYKRDNLFKILHVGNWGNDQNSPELFAALKNIGILKKDFLNHLKVTNYGKVSADVMKSVRLYNLEKNFSSKDYIPYENMVREIVNSDLLLIIIARAEKNEMFISAKIFDYLGAKRPIFALAPLNGELAKLIKDHQAGFVIDYKNEELIESKIKKIYEYWLDNKDLNLKYVGIKKYERKILAKQLSSVLDKTWRRNV